MKLIRNIKPSFPARVIMKAANELRRAYIEALRNGLARFETPDRGYSVYSYEVH